MREGGMVHTLHGFVVGSAGDVQMTQYLDIVEDLALAQRTLRSVREEPGAWATLARQLRIGRCMPILAWFEPFLCEPANSTDRSDGRRGVTEMKHRVGLASPASMLHEGAP